MPGSAERTLPVYVLSWNGGDATLACVESVQRSCGLRPETVVVDNGSVDGSVERLRTRLGAERVLASGENRGYAGGMNAALRHLRERGGDRALLLTQDVEVERHALARMLDALESDPRIGVVGPVVVFRERPARLVSAGGMVRPSRVRVEHLRAVRSDAPYRVDWVDGCCLLVRREAAEAAGGFDERYFLYFEDADFGVRVARAGWSIVVAPGAAVRHIKTSVPAAYYFHYMTRNRYRFWRENYGIGAARVGLGVAADTIGTLGHWARAMLGPAPGRERAERRRRFARQLRGAVTGTTTYLFGGRRPSPPPTAAPAAGDDAS